MSNVQVQEYLTQGAMFESQGKYEDALEYYDRALGIDPTNHDAYISKGVALANLERNDEARAQFENALKANRQSGLAYFHLGNLALLAQDMALGFENYNKAISNGFDNAQIYYNLGLLHEENGETELALRNYSKAIGKDPVRPEIRLRKAQLQVYLQAYQEALESLDEMILTNPDIFEGYQMKFVVLMQLGHLDKAEAHLAKAQEMFPGDADFKINRSSLLLARGRPDEAFALLGEIEKGASDDQTLHKVFMERAHIHASGQEVDKAIAELEKAKSLAAKSGDYSQDAQFLLTNCFVAKNDFAKVLEYARELREKAEEGNQYVAACMYYEPLALKNLGRMDEAEGLYRDAIEEFRSMGLSQPGNLETYLLRAMCHFDLGEHEESYELVEYVIRLKPDMPEPRMQKIAILEAMGRTEELEEEKKAVNAMLPPEARLK